MILSDYLKIDYKLDDNGMFAPVLDEDSHFFINFQRLKKTRISEYTHSFEKIHEFFRKIIKLLKNLEKQSRRKVFFMFSLI